MPKKWSNRSDGRNAFNAYTLEHSPFSILMEFRKGHLSRTETINRLEHTDRYGKLSAAQLAIDEAFATRDFAESSGWIDRAKSNLETVATTGPAHGKMDEHKARALFDMSQLPAVSYLACFGELPPVKLVQTAYDASTKTIKKIGEAYTETRSGLLAGMLAEAGVILLGQRYAINNVADGSWLPLHSLYGEDHANRRHHSQENRAWDVTFLTDVGEGPQKSYLVQVKSSPHAGAEKDRYTDHDAEGIIPVHFRPDLTYAPEGNHGLGNAIAEIVAEAEGQEIDVGSLEGRTEKLLDILDK